MGRLTIRIDGEAYIEKVANKYCEDVCSSRNRCNDCPIREVFDKLADYEDLEEQGRLICLPCSIGDTVWRLFSGEIEECKVSMLQQKVDKSWKVRISYPFYLTADEKLDDLGNTWFLTKEEAEAKLKELKEGVE